MKSRAIIVFIVLGLAALACNMPTTTDRTPSAAPGTSTPGVLTLAAQTSQVLQSLTPAVTAAPGDTLIPPLPSATQAPPTATQAAACDQAIFVQDVTVPDGTRMAPNQSFTKTWRLKNTGTCTWDNRYAVIFSGGEAMGAPAVINLPGNVAPNATIDVSINMKAPAAPGTYEGDWKLRNAAGAVFGVYGNQPFFVQIQVIAPTVTFTVTPTITTTPTITVTTAASGLIYDFTANFCQADWRSQAGPLNCPGIEKDLWGYEIRKTNPALENGSTHSGAVLLTVPNSTKDGAITGVFPALPIQAGYRFRATLACLSGANQCSVKYQVNYITGGANPANLIEVQHSYGEGPEQIDLDLSALAGKQVQIVLVVLADGSAEQDEALWINPRVEKP